MNKAEIMRLIERLRRIVSVMANEEEDAVLDAIAALEAAVSTDSEPVALTWIKDGDKTCGYTNWLAETPLGRILITWKGWKETLDASVDEFPGELPHIYGGPDYVKERAEQEFFRRLSLLIAAPVSPPADPYFLGLAHTLLRALKRLSFAAQTSGGTAGRDDELCAAIAQAESAIEESKGYPEPPAVPQSWIGSIPAEESDDEFARQIEADGCPPAVPVQGEAVAWADHYRDTDEPCECGEVRWQRSEPTPAGEHEDWYWKPLFYAAPPAIQQDAQPILDDLGVCTVSHARRLIEEYRKTIAPSMDVERFTEKFGQQEPRDERARLVEALEQCLEFLDDQADADCVGDPAQFMPNKAMRLADDVRAALSQPLQE